MITLKPGYLVSLKSTLSGGVHYTRTDLAAERAEADRAAIERWETVKVTDDPEEHALAVKVRGKAGSMIRGVCSTSSFGLLCPVARESDLDAAIAEARAMVDTFNASARTVRIGVFVLKGRIAESDGEAARAIAGELRDLLAEMKGGIEGADVAAIRDAANRAKRLGAMLDADAGRKVSAAIAEARDVAREIVKRASQKGEDVGAYVATVKLQALSEARFSFLDLDTPTPDGENGAPALPVTLPRALDMAPEAPEAPEAPTYEAPARDLDDPSEADVSNDTKMVAAPAGARKLDL